MTVLDKSRVTPLLPRISIGGRENEHVRPIAELFLDFGDHKLPVLLPVNSQLIVGGKVLKHKDFPGFSVVFTYR